MARKVLLTNGKLVNEGKISNVNILIEGELIKTISENEITEDKVDETIDLNGKYIFPGLIDDQVHFREPGLTHKGDIHSESRAAVAGGITSFMEMPNTVPNALTQELLEDKYQRAAEVSVANYSFFMGASEVIRLSLIAPLLNRLNSFSVEICKICNLEFSFVASSAAMEEDL